MTLSAVGLNYRSAPVAVREQWVFNNDAATSIADAMISDSIAREAIVVSTCNRTEVYGTYTSPEKLISWITNYKTNNRHLDHFYQYKNFAATRHLMKVATGLDSMVLGENQILGQIKQAFKAANSAGTVGKDLQQLFQHTFAVAKKVRADTEIGSHPISVAYAAVKLFDKIFSNVAATKVLLIGTGDMVQLTARYLQQSGVKKFIVCNRTLSNAAKLAEQFSGIAITLDNLTEYLPQADIVISATGSVKPIVSRELVLQALKERKYNPMSIIDLALPRDIDASVATISDVYLYTLDDLQKVVAINANARYDAAAKAEQIIETAATEFMTWLQAQQYLTTLCDFRDHNAQLRDASLQQALKQLELGKEAPKKILEDMAYSLTNKLTHKPTMKLRQASFAQDSKTIDLIQELFGL